MLSINYAFSGKHTILIPILQKNIYLLHVVVNNASIVSVSSHLWLNCCWKKPILFLWRMTSASFPVISTFLNAKWSPGSFSWHNYYEWPKKPSYFALYWFRHQVKSSKLNRSNRGSDEPKCPLDWPHLCVNQLLSWSGWLQEKMYQGISA